MGLQIERKSRGRSLQRGRNSHCGRHRVGHQQSSAVIFAQHHCNPRETARSRAVCSCAKYLCSCPRNRRETSQEKKTKLGSFPGLASLPVAPLNWEWDGHQPGKPTRLLQQSIPGPCVRGRCRRLSDTRAGQGTEIPKPQLDLAAMRPRR